MKLKSAVLLNRNFKGRAILSLALVLLHWPCLFSLVFTTVMGWRTGFDPVSWELERKLSIIVVIFSTIIGSSSSTLRFTLGNMMFKLIPLATARILYYIALCVIYVKLYFAIKSHNNKIATSTKQGEPSAVDNKIIERRQKALNHAKMFFTGITSSFFISNLPTMIIFLTVDQAPICNTVEGILVTISINLSLIGMAFDAAWYFYMKRRSARS